MGPMADADDPVARLAALPGVPEAVAEARAAVDRLLRHPLLRRTRTDAPPTGPAATVAAESVLRGARASAALEGVDWPLDRVRALPGTGPAGPDGEAGLVRGALRVTAAVPGLVRTWRQAPLQALARLHVLAGRDVLPADRLGRPAASAGPGAVARLHALAGLVSTRGPAPAVVLAAVVHGEVAAWAPFGWGDGLVARAAARLVLADRGLDPWGVTVPEVGHQELAAAYGPALVGYRRGDAAGNAGWVRHCAAAVALGAREGLAVGTALGRAERPAVG